MPEQSSGMRLTVAEPLTATMKWMLILFTGFFLLWFLWPAFQAFALQYLALHPDRFLKEGCLWQAVSCIFLHAGIMHFLGNMIFFWVFGSALANAWRRREFLCFFFTCGIGASLFAHGYDLLVRTHPVPSVGASGAIFGLMIGYAMVFGERQILAFFLIPMQAKHFVAILFAIELLLVWRGAQDGVGHVAHVMGGVCGGVYLKVQRWRERAAAGQAAPQAARSRFAGLEAYDDEEA